MTSGLLLAIPTQGQPRSTTGGERTSSGTAAYVVVAFVTGGRAGNVIDGDTLNETSQDDAVDSLEIATRIEPSGAGEVCRSILDALPHWFGIPEAVVDFVTVADRSPSVVAMVEEQDIGIATIVSHSPYAAEIYVMGVLPQYHRKGVGRIMLRTAEEMLSRSGVEFLQVKTLSPSKPDIGYEKTRAFYLAYGFRPLEEFPSLWDSQNPALQMVKAVVAPAERRGLARRSNNRGVQT